MVFDAMSYIISDISRRPVHLFCSSFTSTPHNIVSKPMAAFPHNHHRNNGQRSEIHESCHKDYHQSSERILLRVYKIGHFSILYGEPVFYRKGLLLARLFSEKTRGIATAFASSLSCKNFDIL